MFKKLKKRLEVEEGQPTFLGKPGTAVRSSINDSSSNVPVESVVNSNLEQQQQASKETDNGESLSDTNTASTQELKEVSQFKTATQNNDACASCGKLEACLEKTQDTMTMRLKEQADAFKVKENEAKLLLLEKDNQLEELREVVKSLEAKVATATSEAAMPTATPQNDNGQAYSLLTKKLISTEIDCIEAKSKLCAVEDDLKLKNAVLKEKENEIAVLQKESAGSHQQLVQLRQEMASLQPLYSPTAPQDSDLWKLQMELKATKKAEEDLRSQLEEYRQTMTQEADDLRAQCQQLAAQLTSMKQSHSQMLLEHEKMTLMVSNLTEEKASVLDSNTELANKILTLQTAHQQQLKEKNEFITGLENSIRNLHAQINSLSKDKESIQASLQNALKEKENLIVSLQEDLENATSSEVTRMSCHGEAAAILPMHSMTTDDIDNDDDNDNMQEMHQMSNKSALYSFDLSTSFNHDHKPATLQPVDLTVELQHLQRRIAEMEDTISEKNKALRVQQQTMTDLRKQLQKEMKSKAESSQPPNHDIADIHKIKFEYLKNTILKYMCSNVEETQHMIKAIGTLLSFTPEEFQYVQKSIEYKVCSRIMGYKNQ